MTHTIFIDGAAGTTGLEIRERLEQRSEFSLILLDVAQRKDANAQHRVKHLNSAMGQCQRPAHHANPQCTDRGGQDKTMLRHALSQGESAKADGQNQSDFMNGRMQ